MSANYKPVIVIVAYNRTDSLKRILKSLDKAFIDHDTKLIISIDNNGTNQDVVTLAERYNWKFGEKEVIYQNERLGLRNHVLKCGDLVYQYGSLIMLEDDLFVSPYFYEYTLKALDFYGNDEAISGISLYNLTYSESNKLPFIPLEDSSDVYFMQMAASLGQVWSEKQWDGFRKWYGTNPDLQEISGLPEKIKNWSQSSWKKFFIGYLIVHDKYFVFPRKSYTTNFNDPGENMIMRSFYVQVPLQIRKSDPRFKTFDDSVNIYDAHSEILPSRLNRLTTKFREYDYEVDLYGKKTKYDKPYVITSKHVINRLLGFDRNMKPHEMNIIMDVEGDVFSLARKEDVIITNQSLEDMIKEYTYFYTAVFNSNVLFDILILRMSKKIRNTLRLIIKDKN